MSSVCSLLVHIRCLVSVLEISDQECCPFKNAQDLCSYGAHLGTGNEDLASFSLKMHDICFLTHLFGFRAESEIMQAMSLQPMRFLFS